MNKSVAGGVAFIAVGVVFMALARWGQRAYLPIDAAFVLIGVVFIARRRRAS